MSPDWCFAAVRRCTSCIALQVAQIPPDDILAAFKPYRPETFTATTVIANVRAKLADRGFRGDIAPLLAELPAGYDFDTAAELVTETLLARL